MPKFVDRDERRRQVADAAFRVIAAEGLASVTLQKVATEAGLNIGSLRHYVENYEELLAFAMSSMIDRVAVRLMSLLEDHNQRSAGNPLELAEKLLAELLPLDDDRRLEVTVWLEFSLAARVRPELAKLDRKSAESTRRLVQRVLTGLQGAGDSTPDMERLMSLVDGLAANCLLHPEIVSPARARQVLRDQLRELVRSP